MNKDIAIKKATEQSEIEECFAIRRKVFIQGQNIDEDVEIDGLDNECDHYIMKSKNSAIGTARVRYIDGKAKIQRLAILDEYRGQGLSKKLMQFLIEDIKAKNISTIFLSSQSYIIPLYEALGFKQEGEEYEIAGIMHKDMYLTISQI